MTAGRRRSAWPLVLGGCATLAAGAVLAPWVTATGTRLPVSSDLAEHQIRQSGVAEALSVSGARGVTGALLLVLASLLVTVACWRCSPGYRPVPAGYIAIAGALAAIGLIVLFLRDPYRQRRAFGAAWQVQSDTVALTPWPWLCLAGFAGACVAGMLLVPGNGVPAQ